MKIERISNAAPGEDRGPRLIRLGSHLLRGNIVCLKGHQVLGVSLRHLWGDGVIGVVIPANLHGTFLREKGVEIFPGQLWVLGRQKGPIVVRFLLCQDFSQTLPGPAGFVGAVRGGWLHFERARRSAVSSSP